MRLDAWVAASQPQLGPARRKVLLSVAELTQDGDWVASSQVKELSGGQRQPVNRHLRALEEDGLVALQFRGRGMPLYVKATSAGLRAVGLRGPLRAPEPAAEALPAPRTDQPEFAPAPAPARTGRLERFASSLYQALQPYLAGLEYQEFRRLLIINLAAALGRRPVAAAVAAAAPAIPAPAAPQPLSAGDAIGLAVRAAVSQALNPPTVPAPGPEAAAPSPPETPAPLPAPAQAAAPTPEPVAPEILPPERPTGPALRLPMLNAAEQALEERLASSANPQYRDTPWWQRTKDFSDLWDRVRRWRLGRLGTYFTSFAPRWEHPDWASFNRARRQADARGAHYGDWIEAQFDRLDNRVPPRDLLGDEAAEAWQSRMMKAEPETAQSGELGPPPYTNESFNVHNPDHAAYAEELLGQILSLARRVYGEDADGAVRLLSQAVLSGNLPLAALDLRPQYKAQAYAVLGNQSPSLAPPSAAQTAAAAAVMAATRPAVII